MPRGPTYQRLPDVLRGYPLGDLFSVVIPEATTNLFTNPSFERATTGHSAVGAGTTIARSTEEQWSGAYSLKVVPAGIIVTEGWQSGTVALTAGTVYTMSAWFKGRAGYRYTATFFDSTTPSVIRLVDFSATGFWQRVIVTATAVTTTSHAMRIRKNASASDTAPFYVDAVQCEEKSYATDYCDGSLKGVVPTERFYRWNGTEHLSTSSRSAQCRTGGRDVRLSAYGFLLLSIIGLGMAPFVNNAIPSGVIGGSSYQNTTLQDRQFQLVGDLRDPSFQNLDRQIQALEAILKPDVTTPRQPLVLRYQTEDDCGDPAGEIMEILCHLAAPPVQAIDNRQQVNTTLPFIQYFPLIRGGMGGASLGLNTSIASVNNLLQRNTSGVWSAMGTGVSGGDPLVMLVDGDRVYIGGSFTSAGGVANTNLVCYWDRTTDAFGSIGVNVGTSVQALARLPDGRIAIGGNFTSIDGTAAASIAIWDPVAGTASALGTGAAGGSVLALTVTHDGRLVAGGTFTSMDGVANTLRLAVYDFSTPAWSAIGTGANGQVSALMTGANSLVYIGGDFTAVAGTTAASVASWDPATAGTVSALGSGIGPVGAAALGLTMLADGKVAAFGIWPYINGTATPADNTGFWNGSYWQGMGEGVTPSSTRGVLDPTNNLLYVYGTTMAASGDVAIPGSLAIWTGSDWLPVDVIPPDPGAGVNGSALAIAPSGSLFYGFQDAGTATVPATTTITNDGNADTWPLIEFVGPGTIVRLANLTTKRSIYFNLTLNDDERAVLDLQPDNISFVSDQRGDISSTILRGSQEGNFFLQGKDLSNSGQNVISLLMTGTDAGSSATMQWREHYWSIAGGTP